MEDVNLKQTKNNKNKQFSNVVGQTSDIIAQRKIRMEKAEKLRELGIDPYPPESEKDVSNAEIVSNFEKYEGKKLNVTGRIFLIRKMGKIAFIDVRDQSGKIQLFLRKNVVKPLDAQEQTIGFDELSLLDRGDFVQAYGEVIKTQTGEVSILVEKLKILTKSLRPLPDKWKGVKNEELLTRRRYLQMILDAKMRERFVRRSKFWQAVRDFLNDHGFVEINIPVLELVTGGADAKPFVTYYNELDQDFYLRISHELPLKKLLGAGYEKVYDIGPRFRNEGFSPEHLPEHIAMEWYWAYADYMTAIKFTKQMFIYILDKVFDGKRKFTIRGLEVDFSKSDWPIVDYAQLLKERFNVDIYNDSVEDLYKVLEKNGRTLEPNQRNRNRVVDSLWKLIRVTIAGPIFLVNVPKFLSPLAKSDPNNPEVTMRFHLVAGGTEMTNAFSELNDPQDQLERFIEQQKLREQGDDEAHMLDIDFVEMLEYGMPPATGFGMSERVFWLLEGVSAREGVPFAHYKYDLMEDTKKVYKDILKYIAPQKSKLAKCLKENKSK